jgi:hypothetical protein
MKKHHDDEPSRIDMSEGELSQLIAEIKASSLKDKSKDIIVSVLLSFLWLNQQLDRKTLSIKKLLRIFFGRKTEKSPKKNDNDPKDGGSGTKPEEPKPPKPKPKGHGKNGQAKFENAERVTVAHPTLSSQDSCPSCGVGKLYQFGFAAVLRLFGQAPLIAKVYELEQLRCANCQELITAPLPEEAGANRHHPTANAMVACLNYGTGVPFYRLESLQKQLGTPLADSTQFDMAETVANCGAPVVDHLKSLASSAEQQGFDDTPMPVLSLLKENQGLSATDRKGMQTSAVVAKNGENKIALFITGRNHAGENMGVLLKNRDPSLPKVIQMSDASANNFSHEFTDMVIKALCMDHGRRNFHELLEAFPKDCQHVITELGLVYKNDADTKTMGLSPIERLFYHQEHSGPIMNGLNAWMEEKIENKEVEPNSELGKAIDYFLKHWNGLTVFLRVVGAPLSNAEVERLVKRCVLRRKVSMFYKTETGAWIGDILMSLIETSRFAGKNPFDYLVALQKYATQVRVCPENWLPWNYQKTLAAL